MKFQYSWWQACLIVCAIGLFILMLPILALNGALSLTSTFSIRDFIDLMAVIISWPVAVVVIAFRFMSKFNNALDTYLRNIGLIKLPGGVEIQPNQNIFSDVSVTSSEQDLILTSEQQEQISAFIASLEKSADLNEVQKKNLERELDNMANIAIQWKFRFLDEFFVNNTRKVLFWFSNVQLQTRNSFLIIWQEAISDEKQRNLILDLLLHFGFLNDEHGLIKITEHGYSFLQFIGLIPPTPTVG